LNGEFVKPIIILSGPVGAGKTTVAKELVAISKAPLAYIEGDKFWFFIAKAERAQIAEKNFRMIMRSMVAAAIPYALNGYETIVDFSLPPWFLDTALKMANYRDIPLDYVVVRPSIEICATRAATRTDGTIKDYKRLRELYKDFDEAEPNTIADDEADASTVAKMIRQGLDEGKFRLTV
jgi:tRNA uridine 5-carbamoylmethylation protein Kti12